MSNLADRPTFVTHLECSFTGAEHQADIPHNLSAAGKPLLVRYDLEGVSATIDRADLATRAGGLWRYRELLPVRRSDDIVSLGETTTPLVPLSNGLVIKEEGRLPTGSFKARGLAVAVSMAKELGISRMAMASNGNAGAALAAYGARAGIATHVVCPTDTPEVNLREIAMHGAQVWRVDGLIDDCGRVVAEGAKTMRWFDTSTLKEPYRIEGKKTMGLELAEQLGWELPDVIFYPTGGGTGLIGMWKAFSEMAALGWIGDRRPRMVAVQAAGCAPIVRAFEAGERHATRWEGARTIAAGIRVPAAIGDFLILDAVRESDGYALAVDDDEIVAQRDRVAAEDGLLLCPEGAATVAAYVGSLAEGRVSPDDRCVAFNCATGLKYPMPPVERSLDHARPVDWTAP